ncbi:MAG TPA: hypothetical protein VFO95_17300 [Gemmatimonadales bacterium]|nr:hypothetical protein [Gemmatimonadales bacterium]
MTRTAGRSVPSELWRRVAAATQYDQPVEPRRSRSGWVLLGLGLLSGGIGGTWVAYREPRDPAARLEQARERQERAAAAVTVRHFDSATAVASSPER